MDWGHRLVFSLAFSDQVITLYRVFMYSIQFYLPKCFFLLSWNMRNALDSTKHFLFYVTLKLPKTFASKLSIKTLPDLPVLIEAKKLERIYFIQIWSDKIPNLWGWAWKNVKTEHCYLTDFIWWHLEI